MRKGKVEVSGRWAKDEREGMVGVMGKGRGRCFTGRGKGGPGDGGAQLAEPPPRSAAVNGAFSSQDGSCGLVILCSSGRKLQGITA